MECNDMVRFNKNYEIFSFSFDTDGASDLMLLQLVYLW